MRRRSFLARCAAALAALLGASRTPAPTQINANELFDVMRKVGEQYRPRASFVVVVVTRSAGSKAEGRRYVGNDGSNWVGSGEPCWLFEANGRPLREGWAYAATPCPGDALPGLPAYVCTAAPVESA